MKAPKPPPWLPLCCGFLLAGHPAACKADDANGVTAVSSRVSRDYARARQADGSFQPEYFAFGEGGNWGGDIKDATIDKFRFMDVARVIAPLLASQGYRPAREPARTGLLIMLYWGTTAVPPPCEADPMYQNFHQDVEEYRLLLAEGQYDEAQAVYSAGLAQLALSNAMRDRIDFKNAGMLGYNTDSGALIGTDYGVNIGRTALGTDQRDQLAEIEENRYFVVLMAYDFQLLWRQKKHKLLWETRFSIGERRNQFDRALPVMARFASQYFGQPSNGIQRTRVPEGNVEVREPTLIEFLTEPKK
jgi:hypothetical protein